MAPPRARTSSVVPSDMPVLHRLYLLLGLHALCYAAAQEQPFHRPPHATSACSATKQKLDCGLFRPPGEASCRSAGCCWDPAREPHCFFSNNRPSPRRDGVQVHLFEWSWADVRAECKWLGEAGYTGVQVSPPQEDIIVKDYPDSHIRQEPWWTRYQPVSYQLASRSGNESQFIDMVHHCRTHGVDIYVDVVINHMAGGSLGDPSGLGRAGTRWQYRQSYGDLYSSADFHHRMGDGFSLHGNCQIQDRNFHSCYDCVQQCDLGGLADLDTSKQSVQGKIAEYLNRLAQLGVAGVRVDAAKHMNSWDMGSIFQGVNSSLYVYQEVLEGCNELVTAEEYVSLGEVIEFRWAQMVFDRFTERDLQFLGSEYLPCGHLPSKSALVFVENHDRQSNCHVPDPEVPCISVTVKNGDLYKVAVAFTLAYPYGSPQVLSSYAYSSHGQGAPRAAVHRADGSLSCGDPNAWYCQHRWPEISGMVGWRRSAGDSGISHWWLSSSKQQVQFSRRNAAVLFMNVGREAFHGRLYDTKLPAGEYCNVYKGGCESVKILDDGSTVESVSIASDSVLALHTRSVTNRSVPTA